MYKKYVRTSRLLRYNWTEHFENRTVRVWVRLIHTARPLYSCALLLLVLLCPFATSKRGLRTYVASVPTEEYHQSVHAYTKRESRTRRRIHVEPKPIHSNAKSNALESVLFLCGSGRMENGHFVRLTHCQTQLYYSYNFFNKGCNVIFYHDDLY